MRLLSVVTMLGVLEGCTAYSALRPAPLPEGARVLRNIAYAPPGADPDRRRLDLYLPKSTGKHPVLIFLHGGYWQAGGRQEAFGVYERLGRRLTARGVIAVVVSYRLSPEYKYPVHIEDVGAAIASTLRNVEKHGGDPQRIYLAGHSAGGHLAMMALLERRWLAGHGASPRALAGVVAISGIYDVDELGRSYFGGRNVRRVFGHDEAIWKRASPVRVLGKRPSTPILLAIGDDDEPMLREQHVAMLAALKRAGAQVEAVEVEGRTHVTIVTELFGDEDPLGDAILRFMERPLSSK